jgi:flagellum-specific peptidoglycan hydrolase FlgJ
VLLSLLTTAYGLFIGNTVYDSEIQRVNGVLMKGALSITKSITDALFGSGIFGDKGFGGTLALIAKLSLLFAAGREYVTKAALGTVTFPTTLANSTSTYLQSQYAGLMADRRKKELEAVEKTFEKSKTDRDNAIRDLSKLRLGNNRTLSTSEATQIANSRGALPFGTLRAAAIGGPNTVNELARLSTAARAAADNFNRLETTQKSHLESLRKVVEATSKHAEGLKNTVREQATAARTGTINTAAGIGGIFGALGGFNLGTQIAEGMTNANDWQKVGVILGTTMLGQGLLAGIASALTAVVLTLIPMALGLIGAGLSAIFAGIFATAGFVLASPILLTLALGAAALAAVLNWDKLVDVFKAGWNLAVPIFKTAWDEMSKMLNSFLDSVKKWWEDSGRDGAKKAGKAVLDTKVPGTSGNVGDAVGVSAATIAALSAFSLQYTQLPATLAGIAASLRNSLIAVQIQVGALGPQLAPIVGTLLAGAATLTGVFTSPVWGSIALAIASLGAAVLAWKAWSATREWFSSPPPSKDSNVPIKPFADISQIPGRAAGGMIYGPGTGTSDSIPAMLSNGEFVVNAEATSRNRGLLHRINNGHAVRYFASGGYVSPDDQDAIFREMEQRIAKDGILGVYQQAAKLKKKENSKGIDAEDTKALMNAATEFLYLNTGFPPPTLLKSIYGFRQTLVKPATAAFVRDGSTDRVLDDNKAVFVGENATPEKEKAFQGLKTYLHQAALTDVTRSLANSVVLLLSQLLFKSIGAKAYGAAGGTGGVAALGYEALGDGANLVRRILQIAGLENQLPVVQGVSRGLRLRDAYTALPAKISNWLYDFEDAALPSFSLLGEHLLRWTDFKDDDALMKSLGNRKASGGMIYGPGTGTSDSIPAMLSNGEFVVNAESTKRNRGLLEKINNNSSVRYFSQGGFVEAYTPAAQRVGKMLGVDPDIILRHWALESGYGKSLMTPFHNLANITAGANYKGTTTRSADTDADGKKITQTFRTYSNVDAFAEDYVALIKRQYKNAENAGESMLKFATALKEGGWATSRTYVEDLLSTNTANRNSPWRGRTNQVVSTGLDGAINWDAMPFGIGEHLKKVDFGAFPGGRHVERALAWIAEMLTVKSKKIEQALDPLGDSFDTAAFAVNAALGDGSGFSRDNFKAMGKQELDIIRNAVNTINFVRPNASELEKHADAKAAKEAVKVLRDAMTGGVKSSSSIMESFKGKSTVESIEILNNAVRSNINDAFSMSEYERLSSSDIRRIMEVIDISNELKSKMAGMSDFELDTTNKFLKELWEQVTAIKERVSYVSVSSSGQPFSANAQKAGTTFATSFQTELSTAIASTLAGKSTFKQFGKLILETLSASVLNNFSKGFVEKIFETTKLGDYLSKGISEIYTFGEKGGKSLGSGIASLYDKPPLTMADRRLITNPNIELSEKSTELLEKPLKFETEPLKEVLSTSWTSLGSILSGIGSGIGDVVTGIGSGIGKFFSLFAFADGGYVRGPGTSTSDSIPAMLSNGEFVINAKATQKYGALLQRINTDTMPHFASGGLVSELPRTINSEENKSNNTSGGNTSVFNINITGDISMQTRKQVMSMIPEIAAGTNAHNREINYSYGKR